MHTPSKASRTNPAIPYRCYGRSCHAVCAGFSLVEMMISMTIGLVVIAAAGQLFISGKRSMNLQKTQAAYQEQSGLLGTMITGLLRQSGHIDISDGGIDRKLVFMPTSVFSGAGQVLKGTAAEANRNVLTQEGETTQSFPNDEISFRFEGGDEIFDCEGNPTIAGTFYQHSFKVVNEQLVCIPGIGQVPVSLVGTRGGLPSQRIRVLGMRVLYGIDQTGDGSINDYNRANEMAPGDWLATVNSWLEITLQAGDLPPTTTRLSIHYSNLH